MSEDEAHGVSALASALEAPFRQIVHNHGIIHPPVALHEARRRGPGYGFDVLAGEYLHMADAGVLDCLGVARGALGAAASAAVMTITTDALVLVSPERQRPEAEP
jgi:chaperonin GroEL